MVAEDQVIGMPADQLREVLNNGVREREMVSFKLK